MSYLCLFKMAVKMWVKCSRWNMMFEKMLKLNTTDSVCTCVCVCVCVYARVRVCAHAMSHVRLVSVCVSGLHGPVWGTSVFPVEEHLPFSDRRQEPHNLHKGGLSEFIWNTEVGADYVLAVPVERHTLVLWSMMSMKKGWRFGILWWWSSCSATNRYVMEHYLWKNKTYSSGRWTLSSLRGLCNLWNCTAYTILHCIWIPFSKDESEWRLA